jgi:acetoin utilization deacetylase AcuC-like enzyme
MILFYSPDYTPLDAEEITLRKPGLVAASLTLAPISGVILSEPRILKAAELLPTHDARYIQTVYRGFPRSLATSNHFAWSESIWTSALASTSGIVAAAEHSFRNRVNSGSLSSGLHHARRDRGCGFCTFNGLALAALRALDAGAHRVLILDLDAHGGGGTHSIVGHEPRIVHIDLCTDAFDEHPASPPSIYRRVTSSAVYLEAINEALATLDSTQFDLCLYNAGMDPHEGSQLGGLPGITSEVLREREALVFRWARAKGIPVAFTLAGGYPSERLPESQLIDLHRMTIKAAAAQA